MAQLPKEITVTFQIERSQTMASWYPNNAWKTATTLPKGPFTQVSFEEAGIDQDKLLDGVDMMEDSTRRKTTSIIVMRNGNLVYEGYFNGANKYTSMNIHSASKAINAAMIVELLDGHCEYPLCTQMPELFAKYDNNDKRLKITFHDMLTMQSGLRWEDDSTEYQIERRNTDWAQAVLDQGLVADPGKRFEYSTGNYHAMSPAFHMTDMKMAQYTQLHLFNPLGIEPTYWPTDPAGNSMGGCNIYLTARELAAFGWLFCNEGKALDGTQVIDKSTVNACLTDYVPREGYGYGWWHETINGIDAWKAWGWCGQMIYVFRELGLMFVTTSDTYNAETERNTPFESFVRDYLLPSVQYGPQPEPEPDPDPEPDPEPDPQPHPKPRPKPNPWHDKRRRGRR